MFGGTPALKFQEIGRGYEITHEHSSASTNRPIDPSTHGPIRLAALVAAHLRKGILNCSDLQGSQVFALDSVLKFRREVRVWLNGEALPFCHSRQ